MNNFTNNGETWHEYIQKLPWTKTTSIDSARKAFKMARQRGIPRPVAFYHVVERIYRSFCPVNWGALNWQWRLAHQDADEAVSGKPAAAIELGGGSSRVANITPQPINGKARRHHHNTARTWQRRPSSLISYYA